MKEWMKYLLILVGTYVLVVLVRLLVKRETDSLEDVFLMSLIMTVPLSISNFFLYKINKKIDNIKNKNKNK